MMSQIGADVKGQFGLDCSDPAFADMVRDTDTPPTAAHCGPVKWYSIRVAGSGVEVARG
jgi:hypothetical protein